MHSYGTHTPPIFDSRQSGMQRDIILGLGLEAKQKKAMKSNTKDKKQK
jgi:hypothetical protein